MEKISLKIPTYLSNFNKLSNSRTVAKLKVMYIGETPDGRIFDRQMAEQLKESLPYAPVIAFYSDLKKDFLGHNGTQYMYGVVRGDAKIDFVEEGDKTWLCTEVLLYTDREDNIGEIANRIIGHEQSLEIDPSSVAYDIIEEGDGKRKVKFTKGRIFGLSVLGTTESPAFTGSTFFCEDKNKDNETNFKILIDSLEAYAKSKQLELNKERTEALTKFINLSYSQQERLVAEEIQAQVGDYCSIGVIDMYDDYVICIKLEGESSKFYKYGYTISETRNVVLSAEEEVIHAWATVNGGKMLEAINATSDDVITDIVVQPGTTATIIEPAVVELTATLEEKNETEAACGTGKKKKTRAARDENDDDEEPGNPAEEEEEEEKDNYTAQPTSVTALDNSERDELTEYRMLRKQGLIAEYDELLPALEMKEFKDNVDNFTPVTLENALAIKLGKFTMMKNKKQVNNFRITTVANSGKGIDKPEKVDDLIARLLNK